MSPLGSDRGSIRLRLGGGDRRSSGTAGVVAAEAMANPALISVLVDLMRDADPLIRMRAADALEKVTRERPHLIAPHATALVREFGPIAQQEIRWHVALMLPRLSIRGDLRQEAVALLRSYLSDRSRIVVAEAMSALAFFAEDDPALRGWLIPVLRESAARGVPSARSRARRLLEEMADDG